MSQPSLASAKLESQLPADDIIVLRDATWADYQRLLEIRGEEPVPRLTYLEGVLELMTPSRPHEFIKSMIGRLIETWCLEHGVAITPYGSWTHESKEAERGAEPDECYVLDDTEDPERCDLAIEVVWSKRAIDKLEVYKKLGVKEVWIWKRGTIEMFSLRATEYVSIDGSALLPGIDVATLVRFIDVRPMTRAVTEYRAALHAQS
jgi:Uma2 family endonuclease